MTVDYNELSEQLTGVNVLLTTPFTDDGDVDERTLREKVAFLLAAGIREETGALIAVGSVGESATVSAADHERIVRTVVDEVDGALPVVAGANHSGTALARKLASQSVAAGADAIMAVPPYYYPPSVGSVRAHLTGIADAVAGDAGMVIYNNSIVSGIDMPFDLVTELARRPEFVAIKEPTLDTAKLDRVVSAVGDELTVLNGNGDPLEPQCYLLGTRGFTSAWANAIPEVSLLLHELGTSGEYDRLRAARRKYVTPITELLATVEPEHSPAFLKALEEARGVPGGGPVRSPHPDLPADVNAQLREAVAGIDFP